MHEQDKLLDDFFQKIKEQDKLQKIPPMEDFMTVNKTLWFNKPRLMIAACFTVVLVSIAMIWVLPNDSSTESISKKSEEIPPNYSSELTSWEEPTKSLLEEF